MKIFKTISLVLTALLFSTMGMAQTIVKADSLTLDQVKYRITYATQKVRNPEAAERKYGKDQMRLDIGAGGVTRFYSGLKAAYRNEMRQQLLTTGSIDMRTMKAAKSEISWEFYTNHPSGKTTMLDAVARDYYKVVENVESPEWTIVGDSTKTILGYECQQARTRFKGRDWTVWFTEDIPLNYGPWKLGGLPGLVLSAESGDHDWLFTAEGMETIDGREPLQQIVEKREEIDQKTLRRLHDNFSLADLVIGDGGEKGKVFDQNGNPVKLSNKKVTYVSIELE